MKELLKVAKTCIPSVDSIIQEALSRLGVGQISASFGKALVTAEQLALEIYKDYEKSAIDKLAEEWLKRQGEEVREKMKGIASEEGWDEFIKKAKVLFSDFAFLVQSLEKDLGNMRKSRGGRTFEKLVLKLLEAMGIQGEFPRGYAKERLRRIDIVIPSTQVALETPDRAFFLACKRTLRERWRQEVPLAQPNQRVYLLTIDEELSESKAREIKERGLIAFIRDDLKGKEHLKDKTWIRKLSDLPRELKGI